MIAALSPPHGESALVGLSQDCSTVSNLAAAVSDSASHTDTDTELKLIDAPAVSLQPADPKSAFSVWIERQIAAAPTSRKRELWQLKLKDFQTPRRPWELATTTTRLGPAARPSFVRDQCEALP